VIDLGSPEPLVFTGISGESKPEKLPKSEQK
jgi:hypothetical protein